MIGVFESGIGGLTVMQRKIGARVRLVDAAEAVALQVCDHLGLGDGIAKTASSEGGGCSIYVTDAADPFQKTARLILGQSMVIEQVDIQCTL